MRKGANSALLVDDEPEYLEWVREFLEAQGLQCDVARTAADAMRLLDSKRYRIVLVDMNIPARDAIGSELARRIPLVEKYPGIAVAVRCRNDGYGAHAVVAYTVHDDDSLAGELSKLSCRYVLKGRPVVLKRVINKSLNPPPK